MVETFRDRFRTARGCPLESLQRIRLQGGGRPSNGHRQRRQEIAATARRLAVGKGLVLLALLVSTHAARADRVDDYIRAEMDRRHVPGLSLAVVRDGRVVKAKGYGFANLEWRVRATSDTVYELASLTKPLTATAVMLLVQDGRLGLDDRIGTYLEGAPDTWSRITVRHLLTHTSGIKDYLTEVLNERTRVPGPDTTPEGIVQMVSGLPPSFAPGERRAYSNTNYVLLGLLVHRISGKRYDQLLAERVFTPLSMATTGWDDPAEIVAHRAAGYEWTGDRWRNSASLNPSAWNNGDGGLRSTVLDLARWDAALYGDTLLNESSKRRMWTPVTLADGTTRPYGLGWGVDTLDGHRRVMANGSRSGTSTTLCRFVDDRLTVIVLTNQDDVDTEKIAFYVAGFYLPALARPIYYPVRDTDPHARARIRALLDGFAQGKRDSELLPPGIGVRMSGFRASTVEGKTLSEALHSLGPVRALTLVERKEDGGQRLRRYRVAYPEDSVLVGCTFGKDDRILSLSFERE